MRKTSKPVKIPHVQLTERYAQAVAYASAIHAIQTRKGDGNTTAYMSHLLGVSALVLEAGGTEDEAIAGLLHDAAEDAGGEPRLADIRARFGKRVAKIVRACSDSTDEAWKRSVDYWERKQRYLKHLEHEADERAVLVSLADKVHNARAIVTDLHRNADDPIAFMEATFNGSPEQVLEYYSECLRIGRIRNVTDVLTWPLHDAVEAIKRVVSGDAA